LPLLALLVDLILDDIVEVRRRPRPPTLFNLQR
jgi:hypothetical protein